MIDSKYCLFQISGLFCESLPGNVFEQRTARIKSISKNSEDLNGSKKIAHYFYLSAIKSRLLIDITMFYWNL